MAQRLLLVLAAAAVACGPPPTARAQVSYSSLYQRPAERPALALDHSLLARSPQANAHSPEQARQGMGLGADMITSPSSGRGDAPRTAAAAAATQPPTCCSLPAFRPLRRCTWRLRGPARMQ